MSFHVEGLRLQLLRLTLEAESPGAVLIAAPAVYAAAGLRSVNLVIHVALSAVGLRYDAFYLKSLTYTAERDANCAAIKGICTRSG